MRTPIRATFSRRTPCSLSTFGPSFRKLQTEKKAWMAYPSPPLLQTGMFSGTHEYGITQSDMIRTVSFLRRIQTQRHCRIRGRPSLALEGAGVLDSTLRMRRRCITVQWSSGHSIFEYRMGNRCPLPARPCGEMPLFGEFLVGLEKNFIADGFPFFFFFLSFLGRRNLG